jgi:hypothetical protein
MALTAQRIIDALFFNQETDPTPIDQTYILLDHPSWDEPRKILYPLTASDSGVLLGGNLITSSGWTFAGWTGNESIGWTHVTGNTSVLSNVLSAISGKTYQLQLTVSNRTAGSFIVNFGGDTSPALISSTTYSLTATSNGNLTITPTSAFDGTILIALKEVVWELTREELLAILGIEDISGLNTGDQDLSGLVEKETGKSLIADTEIARLLTIKSNPYQILMPAGNIATKIAGAIFSPTGWATIAQSGDYDAIITHTLTDRKVGFVNVFETDSGDRLLSFDKGTAYTGILGGATTVKIEGLAPTSLPIRVELIFD